MCACVLLHHGGFRNNWPISKYQKISLSTLLAIATSNYARVLMMTNFWKAVIKSRFNFFMISYRHHKRPTKRKQIIVIYLNWHYRKTYENTVFQFSRETPNTRNEMRKCVYYTLCLYVSLIDRYPPDASPTRIWLVFSIYFANS